MNEIKINTAQFQRALAKAIEMKPLVRIGAGDGQYLVRGSKRNGDGLGGYVFYPVKFQLGGGGRRLASCLCAGGQRGFHCYHLAAALLAHSAFVRAGLRSAAARRETSPNVWQGSDEMRAYI